MKSIKSIKHYGGSNSTFYNFHFFQMIHQIVLQVRPTFPLVMMNQQAPHCSSNTVNVSLCVNTLPLTVFPNENK